MPNKIKLKVCVGAGVVVEVGIIEKQNKHLMKILSWNYDQIKPKSSSNPCGGGGRESVAVPD